MPAATYSGLSYTFYLGDGTSKTFDIGFGYLSTSHIQVQVDGTTQSVGVNYTITNSDVVFVNAPAANADIRVRRITPREYSARLVDFRAYGTITEDEMDNNQKQVWYLIQEAIEQDDRGDINPNAEYLQWDEVAAVWTALRNDERQRIANVGEPSNGTDAATKEYVDNVAEFGSAGVPQSWNFTAGAGQTQYTLTGGQFLDANYLIVSIEGVLQRPGVDFTVNTGSPNSELVFATAQATAGQEIGVQNFGKARFLNALSLGANAVTTVNIADAAITTQKIVAGAITESLLADLSVSSGKIQTQAVTATKIASAAVNYSKLQTLGFTTAPGGSFDHYLKVNRSTGNLGLAPVLVDDISDWLAELANVRLNQLAAPNAALAMGGNRITNVTNPTSPQDVATKDYVDTAVGSGTGPKIDLVLDRTLGATANLHNLFGAPSYTDAWLQDSTYLFYEVYVTAFQWAGTWLSFQTYKSGAYTLFAEVNENNFEVPTGYRSAWSFKLWQPRTGTDRCWISAIGAGVALRGDPGAGPIDGLRLAGDNGATSIAGNFRILVYGHRAL